MIVAGERSGDIYGAGLARALQARLPGLEIFGCGGEAMRQAAVDTAVDSHQIAIAGITEVVAGIPRAYRAFHQLLEEVDRRHPQLAILIDFPDFNLRHGAAAQEAANTGGLLRKPPGLGVAQGARPEVEGTHREDDRHLRF